LDLDLDLHGEDLDFDLDSGGKDLDLDLDLNFEDLTTSLPTMKRLEFWHLQIWQKISAWKLPPCSSPG